MGRATTLIQRVTASHVEFRRMLMTVQIVGRVYAIAAPLTPPCFAYARVRDFALPIPFPDLYRRRCVNNPNLSWGPGKKKERKESSNPFASSSLASRPRIPSRSRGISTFCSSTILESMSRWISGQVVRTVRIMKFGDSSLLEESAT